MVDHDAEQRRAAFHAHLARCDGLLVLLWALILGVGGALLYFRFWG